MTTEPTPFDTALELAQLERARLATMVHRITSQDDEYTLCGITVDNRIVVALTYSTCESCERHKPTDPTCIVCKGPRDSGSEYCKPCERNFTTGDQEWEWTE